MCQVNILILWKTLQDRHGAISKTLLKQTCLQEQLFGSWNHLQRLAIKLCRLMHRMAKICHFTSAKKRYTFARVGPRCRKHLLSIGTSPAPASRETSNRLCRGVFDDSESRRVENDDVLIGGAKESSNTQWYDYRRLNWPYFNVSRNIMYIYIYPYIYLLFESEVLSDKIL